MAFNKGTGMFGHMTILLGKEFHFFISAPLCALGSFKWEAIEFRISCGFQISYFMPFRYWP